jgi:hypothetical protein
MDSNSTNTKLILPKFESTTAIHADNLKQLSHGKTYHRIVGPAEGQLIVCMHGISWWSFNFYFMEQFLVDLGYRVLLFGNEYFRSF